ncbi:hypothetical protein PAXRUDRAFT_132388 [Paxillus rubicundulus Ve08.2h10]|uniref:Protein OS-9 homolog n=1 Tax=Paxillus rubicundulus Ve08.2h10 TaxID=930991 RepID=A0A0D0ECF9_9AGAM|nr:hypothetical protein PAXRUDRAFT_132388 [Paxillus rubicundulus Ve08.2h10]
MRHFALQAVALALSPIALSEARLLYSGPEDLFAFPKYRVAFLNNIPVLNETAQRWLQHGLRGGEQEFLGESWDEPTWHAQPPMREIGSSEIGNQQDAPKLEPSLYSLEHMRMGPDNNFLCLIPPARDIRALAPEESDGDETIRNSWSLLQPLSEKCLYYRQTWFTYSYCHNRLIRQFKELVPPHAPTVLTNYPHHLLKFVQWDAFTLGRAPTAAENSADVAVADQPSQAANLEVAHVPGSRYLVQRWGDGTLCDKTGKPREAEVHFHCSTTMTDSILLVRETKPCSYLLVIQTPRLCGQPGFKFTPENRDESLIRCREIIDTFSDPLSESTQLEQRQADVHMNSDESVHPLHLLNRESRFAIPQSSQGDDSSETGERNWDHLWKRIVEVVLKAPELQALTSNNRKVYLDGDENGGVVIEILEEIPMDGGGDGAVQNDITDEEFAHLTDALRKAVQGVKGESDTKEDNRGSEEGEEGESSRNTRDEL